MPPLKVPFQFVDGLGDKTREQLWRNFEEIQRFLGSFTAGGTVAAPATTVTGDLTVTGTVYVGTPAGQLDSWRLELRHPTNSPYIDFTRPPGTADYNVRLINDVAGQLSLDGGAFEVDGTYLRGIGGRNYFKDSEKSDGAGLRVGAAWNKYGLYSELGDLSLGAASQRISLQNDILGWIDVNGINSGEAYMGISGAHGAGWAQFSGAPHWNSSGSFGFMHSTDGNWVLLSSHDQGALRRGNSTRLGWGLEHVEIVGARFVLNSNYLHSRGWGDDWHVHHWWSGNDGWRITEYGGLYFRVRDQDPALEITATGITRARRFDQIGAYDTSALMTYSLGGGTGAKVGFWSAGQNAAHIHKCWGSSIEVRTWDDVGWGYSVGDFNDVCTMRAKIPASVEALADKLPTATRKAKLKRLRAVKYQRPLEDACVNCLATGLKAQNQRFSENERAAMVAGGLFGASLEPCPDCQGTKKRKVEKGTQKNHDTGYFGFVAEEVAEEFPEAIWYDTDGLPTAMKPAALIAVLWEEVKDLEERLAAVERGRP